MLDSLFLINTIEFLLYDPLTDRPIGKWARLVHSRAIATTDHEIAIVIT